MTNTLNFTKLLTLTGLVGTALMGGVFYAFGTAVMGSLQRMPAGQGAAAMNLINVRIQNPLFLLIFMGTALVCVALGIIALVKDAPGKWWLVAGAALYLVGVIVVSFAVNIPLNDKLATFDPNSAAGAAEWLNYLAKWNPANNLRAVSCALGVVAFGLALASGAGSKTTAAPAIGAGSIARADGAHQGARPAGAPQYGSTQGHQFQLPNPGWQTPQQVAPRPQSWQ
ncbi:putative membrane protein [Kribbella voronezhensis]|uniref:Putative membrane protein n=1 Tax=Kribbella voronezhensis TaxID=2512212 RepID=A0A4R7TD45_9ACTN|nr:anthrone oxygenase family protein [Kribbella voronezhensis]TDU89995.1 putative membrane protein [Kribbella voronezhensis]